MNSKSLKYSLGCLAMVACWVISGLTLCAKAPAPVSIASFECEARAIEAELPLPTESEIIGIEFALFEPLPTSKARNSMRAKGKAQNKR